MSRNETIGPLIPSSAGKNIRRTILTRIFTIDQLKKKSRPGMAWGRRHPGGIRRPNDGKVCVYTNRPIFTLTLSTMNGRWQIDDLQVKV